MAILKVSTAEETVRDFRHKPYKKYLGYKRRSAREELKGEQRVFELCCREGI
ncbi:MAG TPA: hypothetical protein VFI27_15265 [candidate division Zixibacteria bacterium]|nr:hypothetical protein [candidate division Zixibacteria bacterium]